MIVCAANRNVAHYAIFFRDIDFSSSLGYTEGEMASAVFRLAEFVVV